MFCWNTVNLYTVLGPMRSVRSEQSIVVGTGNLFLPSITKWGLQCKHKGHNIPARACLASEPYKITLYFHTSTQYSSFCQHKLCVSVRNWLSRSDALVNRNLTPALPADLTGRQSEQLNTSSLAHHAEINHRRYTHRDVPLNLLVGQRDGGGAVGRRRRQGEAVVSGFFCSCQRLLEVLDVTLRLHLQFLSLPTHCCFTDYKNNQEKYH